MIIVFLLVGSFALIFADLVRRSDAYSERPQPVAWRCDGNTGKPCPTRGSL